MPGNYISELIMEEKERPGFEEALTQLESIVQQLEQQDVSLEDSVNLYQKGMELSQICTEILDQAELKIHQVNDQHDQ